MTEFNKCPKCGEERFTFKVHEGETLGKPTCIKCGGLIVI